MSVYMDRITHTSSIHDPSFGKISLTSIPLCPYFSNLNGDPSRAPVLRSVFRLEEGIGLPVYFCSSGLGSNVSTWEGPPFRKRKMTCFAFAGKWGDFGASGPA